MLGIRVGWMLALGWGLASVVGAISGIMVAPLVFLDPNMMQSVIVYAFAAAVLGGIESPIGAVVGGLCSASCSTCSVRTSKRSATSCASRPRSRSSSSCSW